MTKKAYFVHGWEGNPKNAWFPWLKDKLEKEGFKVEAFAMPHPEEPTIKDWVGFLKDNIENIDEETFFVGHSIGCQTIMRYLESLDENIKVGGVVFVGGWLNLLPEVLEDEEDKGVAQPWLEAPIDFDKIKKHCDKFVALFSDNDKYVPISDSKVFEEKLGAKIIVEHEKGHFFDDPKMLELESAFNSIMEMVG